MAGHPAEDVPTLIDALERCRAESSLDENNAFKLEAALRKMTDLDLATDTHVGVWRRRWSTGK